MPSPEPSLLPASVSGAPSPEPSLLPASWVAVPSPSRCQSHRCCPHHGWLYHHWSRRCCHRCCLHHGWPYRHWNHRCCHRCCPHLVRCFHRRCRRLAKCFHWIDRRCCHHRCRRLVYWHFSERFLGSPHRWDRGVAGHAVREKNNSKREKNLVGIEPNKLIFFLFFLFVVGELSHERIFFFSLASPQREEARFLPVLALQLFSRVWARAWGALFFLVFFLFGVGLFAVAAFVFWGFGVFFTPGFFRVVWRVSWLLGWCFFDGVGLLRIGLLLRNILNLWYLHV